MSNCFAEMKSVTKKKKNYRNTQDVVFLRIICINVALIELFFKLYKFYTPLLIKHKLPTTKPLSEDAGNNFVIKTIIWLSKGS